MIIALTTIDDFDKAKNITRELVEQKLAACVSIMLIKSTYFLEGQSIRMRRRILANYQDH